MKRLLLIFICALMVIGNIAAGAMGVNTTICADLTQQYDAIKNKINQLNTEMYTSKEKLTTLNTLHTQAGNVLKAMHENNCTAR